MFGTRCVPRWSIHLLCAWCLAAASLHLPLTIELPACGSVASIECLATPPIAAFSDTAVEATCQSPLTVDWHSKHVAHACNGPAGAKPQATSCKALSESRRGLMNDSLLVLGTGLRL